MQMSEAAELRKAWGDKPCNHPRWDREYYLGAHTGDDVCLDCGRNLDPRTHLEIGHDPSGSN